MQEGITITDNAITGTLKLVSGYTGFSEDVSKQSGNYLALHFSATDDATLSAEYGSETWVTAQLTTTATAAWTVATRTLPTDLRSAPTATATTSTVCSASRATLSAPPTAGTAANSPSSRTASSTSN